MIEMTLSKYDVYLAVTVGMARHIQGMFKEGRYNCPNDKMGWQYNIIGCIGELAAAKHFGLFWNGALGNFKAKDAGHYQVRTTQSDRKCLVLHNPKENNRPGDKPDDIFISVLMVKAATVQLTGWLYGREGQQDKYWDPKAPNPAYFIPFAELHPMDTIPEVDHAI